MTTFSHPFFEKLKELRDRFPFLPYNFRVYKGFQNDNSPYCAEIYLCADCHMCFTCGETARSAFCTHLTKSHKSVDCEAGYDLQLAYECTGFGRKCFGCAYCHSCQQCFNCYFCDSSFGLTDCFGCVELENKKFCIFNKQYSEEEYRQHIKELLKKSPEEILEKVKILRTQIPTVDLPISYENPESQRIAYGFFNNRCDSLLYSWDNEDCAYLTETQKCKSTIDGDLLSRIQLSAELVDCDTVSYSSFLIDCCRTHNSYFCNFCNDCSNCFGCNGLDHKEYHILNKRYSKEDYERITAELLNEFKEKDISLGENWYNIWFSR